MYHQGILPTLPYIFSCVLISFQYYHKPTDIIFVPDSLTISYFEIWPHNFYFLLLFVTVYNTSFLSNTIKLLILSSQMIVLTIPYIEYPPYDVYFLLLLRIFFSNTKKKQLILSLHLIVWIISYIKYCYCFQHFILWQSQIERKTLKL